MTLPSDTKHRPIFLLKQLGVAALYALLLYIDHRYFEGNAVISSFEAASGFALAVLLIGGRRYAWGIFFGGVLANAMTGPLGEAAIISSSDTLEALCGAWLLTHNYKLGESLRDYLYLLIKGGIVGIGIGANIGVTALIVFGYLPPESFSHELVHWWAGDLLGVALVTPLILTFWKTKNEWVDAKQIAEAALLLGLTFVAGQIIFLGWFHSTEGLFKQVAMGYWMFLCIVWVAVRLGTRGTVIAMNMAAIQGLLGAYQGVGFFAEDIAKSQLTNYWFYTLTLSLVGMALATFISTESRNRELLREQEEFFRLISENIADFIAVLDLEGRRIYNNAAYTKIFGYTKNLQGTDSFAEIHPDDRERIKLTFQETIQSGSSPLTKYRFVLPDGGIRDMESSGKLVRDSQGQPSRVVVLSRDITERKQAEKLLRESEERLQGIMNNTSAVIFLKDTAGRYLLVNSRYEKLFHVSSAAIQGKTDHDIFPKDMADAFIEADKKVIQAGHAIDVEEQVPQDDGIHTYISVKFPLRDSSGEIYAVCGIATDITERKKIETALVESHNLLKTVINAVPVRIFWKDKKLRYLGCNRFFAKDAGEASPQDIIGKNDYQLAWKEQAELYNADDRRVMDSGIPKLSYEEPQTTPDGKAVWLRTSKVPLCNADNETIGVLGVYEDITEKKQAEAALRENEERLQGIMNNAPAIIFIKDTAGRYLFVNALHEQLFHIPNATIHGKTDYDIFPRDVADLFIESDRKVIHSGLPLEVEERAPQDDGIHTYILVKFPLRNAFGEIYAVCGIATDITERKQAEERHRTLIDAISSAGIMLFLVDDTYRVRYMNRPMIEAFGDAVGKICYKYVGGIESPCSYCRLFAIIGGHSKMVHYQPTTDDGRTLDIIAIPYVDTDGKICKLEVIQDITERKAAEQQLRDLSTHMLNVREEEKASIAREIHDDLGGTLTALKIGAYWLSRKLPVNQETAPLLERIESMSQLIDNAVVATRRIISGMRPTILDDLGILAAIEWQAVEFYKHTGIECQVNCVEDEDNLDKQRSIALFRILQEALTNVSRHSYASKVEIEFLHSEKEVILMISDNGRGMPGNHVATEKPYGMLGMTERIEQLGGKIIFSSPPDGGFSVTVILPLPADNNKKGEV